MDIPFFQVDAFTSSPFTGNPAAVCLLGAWPDDETLRRIADENNLSETAFAAPEDNAFGLRWFTPRTEVPLCGHGTLSMAHVLLERNEEAERVVFRTLSGDLTVERAGDAYRMDFPSLPPRPCSAPTAIAGALGCVPQVCYVNARTHVAVFAEQREIAELAPNMRAVEELPLPYLVATAPGTDCDFVSRFFAPGVGVPEDPVTGSVHCVLAPLWSERLGKQRMVARQLSKRGGEMICEMNDDRVLITGSAVTVISGTLHLPD